MNEQEIRKLAEFRVFKRLITEVHPSGVVSIVSDTFDYWQVITEFSVQLKDEIMARQPNTIGLNKVVFRPDSGDPADIICGRKFYVADNLDWDDWDNLGNNTVVKHQGKYYEFEIEYWYDDAFNKFILGKEIPEHEIKGSVQCLWDIFGGVVNAAGFKELDPHVGLIYGDSITLTRAQDILQRLKEKGFASSNIVFGIGSFTYQYQTRDSYGFAMKATYGVVNGEPREISKNPKTDTGGTKKSAKGLLRVEKEGDDFVLYDQQTPEQEKQGALKEVFRDGELLIDQTLAEIRTRLHG